MVRQPAVAGQFYPDDPRRLRKELGEMVTSVDRKRRVVGIVAPHAGYVYSGVVAGSIYGAIEIPRTVLVLCPNHHGFGAPTALSPDDAWLTPLGAVPVEKRLSALLQERIPFVTVDTSAHRFEHSLEVQLPFIQFMREDVRIVPLCLGFSDFEHCRQLGLGIGQVVKAYGEDVLIVASSDMTHYESAESARKKDEQALAAVLALDGEGLVKVCRQKRITMCGVIPAAVMLEAAKVLGATAAELVSYRTSGDVTGDNRQVVAYAAVAVY